MAKMLRAPRARRRLSMTSLIDVIFLLLLFFMLTSTFTKFAEVELTAGTAGLPTSGDSPVLFLRLTATQVGVNGTLAELDDLATVVTDLAVGSVDAPQTLLLSMTSDVTAQRMTDVLAILHTTTGLRITVLGAS